MNYRFVVGLHLSEDFYKEVSGVALAAETVAQAGKHYKAFPAFKKHRYKQFEARHSKSKARRHVISFAAYPEVQLDCQHRMALVHTKDVRNLWHDEDA